MSEMKIRYKDLNPFMMVPQKIWAMNLTNDQKILYIRLIHYASQNTKTAWPSRKSLISSVYPDLTFDWARKSFDIDMKRLCEANLVEKRHRLRENGSQQSNEYILNPEIEWIDLGRKNAKKGRAENCPTRAEKHLKTLGRKTALGTRAENRPTLNQIQSELDPTKNNTNTKKREDLDAGCVAPPASAQNPAGLFGDWQGESEGMGTVLEMSAKQDQQRTESQPALTDAHQAKEAGHDEPKSRQKREPKARELTEGSKIWEIYERAYENKYATKPIRNAKQNALCAQLAQRLGFGAGPVIEYYLTHKNRYYIEHTHALGLCVKDCESLHTQMLRGQQMTSTQAHQEDKHGAADDVLQRAMKKIDAKYANK